jgi:hypothetical protein
MSLRWSEERYLRWYTRKTPNWVLGPWQARAVLGPVMRELDRAGVLDLGEHGLAGLAAMVALPLDVVEIGMAWWLKCGTFEFDGRFLVMPNFLEAQESTASDSKRSREKRERARDLARVRAPDTKRDGGDTTPLKAPSDTTPDQTQHGGPDDTKRVGSDTKRDDRSRGVSEVTRSDTPCCAVPSLPSRAEPQREPAAPLTLTGEPQSASSVSSDLEQVFEHWASRQAALTGVPITRLKLTKERKGKVEARLRVDGYSAADLKKAIDGCFDTPHNRNGHYTDLELICRDAQHVDRYMQGPPAEDRRERERWLRAGAPQRALPSGHPAEWKSGEVERKADLIDDDDPPLSPQDAQPHLATALAAVGQASGGTR